MEGKIVLKEDLKNTGLWISKRELTIVTAIAEGKTSREIATELSISAKTVDHYRHKVLKRLSCPNMPNLIHILHQQELLY